jgi:hydrogenase nickel incorporation protein HypA/HybF
MHELSVCQGLMRQLEAIAVEQSAQSINRVLLQIGPLSGIEPALLQQAFPLASAGSIAEQAELVIETLPVRVECRQCGAVTRAEPNKLICAECGDWQTRLVGGDEMLLASVELTR